MSNNERMPWNMPPMAFHTAADYDDERRQAAKGPVIEGGCWFTHPPTIESMEEGYAEDRRNAPPYVPSHPTLKLAM